MKPGNPPIKEAGTGSQAASPIRLRGRRLVLARVIWIMVAVIAMGLFVVSLPADYAHYRIICGASGCSGAWRLQLEDVSALERLSLSAGFYAVYNVALDIVQTLGFWTLGVFIFWRKSDDRMALFVSLMLVSFGSLGIANYTLYALGYSHPVWGLLNRFVESIALISFFASFYLFPDGRFVPRWTRVLVIVLIACQIPYLFSPLYDEGILSALYSLLLLCLLGTLVFARVYRYARVSGPVERQQSKWVIFALTAVIAILVGTGWLALFFPELGQPGIPGMLYTLGSRTVWNLSLLFIPLSIAIAILRYRLWEIDIIINRTLVYGSLSMVLLVVFAVTDELLENLFSLIWDKQSVFTTLIAAVAVAVLFEPLRRRIQTGVDRFVQRRIASDRTSETH